MSLIPATLDDDEAAWVTPILDEIARETRADWAPDDVIRSVNEGRSVLFSTRGGVREDGFIVVRASESMSGVKALFIWVAWSPRGDAVETFWEEVLEIGREAGFSAVEFHSPRKGWNRLAERLGLEAGPTIYRGDL